MNNQRGSGLDSIVRILLMLGVILILAWMFTGPSGPSRLSEDDTEALMNMQQLFGQLREHLLDKSPNENEPISNQKLGLPPPESYRLGKLASAEIIDGGGMRFTFDELFGVKNARLVFMPVRPPNSRRVVRWSCTSPDIDDMERHYPRCRP